MLDTEGYVATWNIGAEKIKGYKADEIVGQHFSKFYTPEDAQAGKPQQNLSAATRDGHVEDEGWRVRKDGTRFWGSVIITALRDPQGALLGFGKVTRDLTERRSALEQLRQSEERFHSLVDAVTDYAIFMLDSTGHVTTWNSGARGLKGYAPEEIIGKHFSIFYTPEDREKGRPEEILGAVRRDGHFEDESWRVRKDGSRFLANVVITALRDAQGEVMGFAKVTRDLTARVEAERTARKLIQEQTAREIAEHAEHEIRLQKEQYRSLSQRLEIVLEGVADGITVQDRTGRVVFANTAAAKICGFDSVDELLNTPPSEVVARFTISDERGRPFDASEFPGRRALAGALSSEAILRVREKSSRRQWWSRVRATAVLGADGTPDMAINIWHDISVERRQQEQTEHLDRATAAFAKSLDQGEMLAELSAAMVPGLADWCSIHLLDGDELRHVSVAHHDPGKLEAAREYQQRFVPNPMQTRGVWQVVRTGVSEMYNDITDDMLVQAAHDAAHLEVLRAAGMKSILLAPIRIRERVAGVLSLVSAESDRSYDRADLALAEELGRRAGAALENTQLYAAAQLARQQAEEASRSKDEFLAALSHELRTPLTAIVGWSSLMAKQSAYPELAKPIEVIRRNAEAQSRIIDEILDVSRIVTGKFRIDPRPADLVSIARAALDSVSMTALARQIEIEFMPGAKHCLLIADEERLQQVAWNLLSNALKFTDPGGTVRLTIRQEGAKAILSVQDTGRGIDPAFLPFVFDRFKQADASIARRSGGLGLGLSLVRHIVELHGGSVSASSGGPGKGATFKVTLPIRAVANPSEPPPASPPPKPRLEGLRILVVDDEPDARELIAEVLSAVGAVTETAASVALAMRALSRSLPDLIVSDIGMPGEDGYSFIERVRASTSLEMSRIPALALTAFVSSQDRARILRAGFNGQLGKPVTPEALVDAVAKLSASIRE